MDTSQQHDDRVHHASLPASRSRLVHRLARAGLCPGRQRQQTISAAGTPIGSLKYLPPVLSLQHHFTQLQGWRPYVGAGLNYTRFSDVRFDDPTNAALHPSIKRNSFGAALQAGVDVPVTDGWLVNADVKKVQISTDVSSAGTKVGTFKVDPWLLSVGIGKRF